jgi:hypothetical protein
MNWQDAHYAIDDTMRRFTFTRPITAEDLATVRNELESVVPDHKVRVEPAWPGDDAVARVDARGPDGLPVFGRIYFAI